MANRSSIYIPTHVSIAEAASFTQIKCSDWSISIVTQAKMETRYRKRRHIRPFILLFQRLDFIQESEGNRERERRVLVHTFSFPSCSLLSIVSLVLIGMWLGARKLFCKLVYFGPIFISSSNQSLIVCLTHFFTHI